MRYYYHNAPDALTAKKLFFIEHKCYAKHCFKNTWGTGYVIFDSKEDVNLWWKEHTGRYFYNEEYEPGTTFTENDAMNEIEESYGKLIDDVLASRDYSLPTLTIGLPFSKTFGKRLFLRFSKSFEEEDISYRFYERYYPIFFKALGISNTELRRRVTRLLYDYFYESQFKKRIEGGKSFTPNKNTSPQKKGNSVTKQKLATNTLSNTIEDFQICPFCKSNNAFGIHYCKHCGKNITTYAMDKNGHGWVDLGLSVLWSTETLEGFYLWRHSEDTFSHGTNMTPFRSFEKRDNQDAATTKWGAKWRTPTKEEFEELVIKCKWEKCLDPISKKHALKAIGPNGNSIIIPVTGYAGCNYKEKPTSLINSLIGSVSLQQFSEVENSHCELWTSSEDITSSKRGFAFIFIGYQDFKKTLTAKEKKQQEIESERISREMESMFRGLEIDRDWSKDMQIERQRKEEERQILRNMGDDSEERKANIKKDEERRRNLWLDTPIEMHFNEDIVFRNTIKPANKNTGLAIRPVADKKWQGKL